MENEPINIPEGEQPLVCDCAEGEAVIENSVLENGDIMSECKNCLRFRKYPSA